MMLKSEKVSIIVMFSIFVAVLVAFLGASGTGDAQYFIGWIENAEKYGIVNGFKENYDMYPPYSALLLYIVYRIFSFVPDAALFSIRLATAGFMLATCVVAQIVFKSEKVTYILFFSVLLSVTNGYLDIFVVPFALVAYYFLKKEDYLLGGLFLCLMCLMKYQPLIIMPIVLAGFVDVSSKKLSIKFEKIIRMGIGALIPLLITFSVYQKPFFWSIYVALFRDSNFISPNGLNFGWLVQFVYEMITGTYTNKVEIMWEVPFRALVSFKYIFVIGYVLTFFWTLLKKKKDIVIILKNSLVVYTLYYLFSTNVHENHFFIGVILAVLLYVEIGEIFIPQLLTSIYMFNVNLAVFYGIWGNNFGFNRIIQGVLDPTIIIAAVNVLLGVILIISLLKVDEEKAFDEI